MKLADLVALAIPGTLAVLLAGCALTQGPTMASSCRASQLDQEVACYCNESGSDSETITAP